MGTAAFVVVAAAAPEVPALLAVESGLVDVGAALVNGRLVTAALEPALVGRIVALPVTEPDPDAAAEPLGPAAPPIGSS